MGATPGMASLSESVDIVWLRDDFRLDDQPSIHAVANRPALFVYVHDDAGGGARPLGGAAKWRLAESLTALEGELSARGARLDIIKGDAEETILALAAAASAARVLWSRRYEGGAKALDARVEKALKAQRRRSADFQRPADARASRTGQARRDAGRHLQGVLAPPSRARPPARSDAGA